MPFNVFISYSREDGQFKEALMKRLKPLEKANKIKLLFVECLKLASVNKELREKLLDSLLLPPNSYTL